MFKRIQVGDIPATNSTHFTSVSLIARGANPSDEELRTKYLLKPLRNKESNLGAWAANYLVIEVDDPNDANTQEFVRAEFRRLWGVD